MVFYHILHFGSAKSDSTEKVVKAAKHLKKKVPNLICEGEVQLDAAIMPEVAKMKSPNGELKGEANVLIFPDINAGNIAYKIFERFSNVRIYGQHAKDWKNQLMIYLVHVVQSAFMIL